MTATATAALWCVACCHQNRPGVEQCVRCHSFDLIDDHRDLAELHGELMAARRDHQAHDRGERLRMARDDRRRLGAA